MHKFTVLAHSMLKDNFTGLIENTTLGDEFDPYGFGLARTHELPMSLQWLYENYPRNNSEVIWETIELMFAGGVAGGKDWTNFFVEGVFPTLGTPYITTSSFTHGVNLAEGMKSSPRAVEGSADRDRLTVSDGALPNEWKFFPAGPDRVSGKLAHHLPVDTCWEHHGR